MVKIQEFIDYCKTNKSNNTFISYKKDILQFEAFLTGNTNISSRKTESLSKDDYVSLFTGKVSNCSGDINENDALNFVNHLKSLNFSDRSIIRKESTLKEFYKFIGKTLVLKRTRLNDTFNYMTDENVHLMMNSMNINKYSDVISKLIIMFLYYLGMRISEMLIIKEKDIVNNEITINAKNKVRTFKLNKEMIDLIEIYRNFKKQKNIESEHFFIGQGDKAISCQKSIRSRINHVASQCQIYDVEPTSLIRNNYLRKTVLNNKGKEVAKMIGVESYFGKACIIKELNDKK